MARQRRSATVGVGLVGWGTIGTGVVRLLQRQAAALSRRVGRRVELVHIADLLVRERRRPRADIRLSTDGAAVVADPRVEIVVELIGGTGAAREIVLGALAAGKDVVTANKALLAVHGAELFAAAERAGVDLAFEAAVGGGIPIIRTLREALAGDRQQAVYGILNGTCNYILTTMTAAGQEFEAVLREAQALGLAEADPKLDVDGVDAAHKLTLLAALAFGVWPPWGEVHVEGIRGIRAMDIRFASELGYVVKLLAIAKDHRDGLEVRVHPTLVPAGHVLAGVGGAFNAIYVQGEALGSSMYYGQGAGMMPTATAVVGDIVELARSRSLGVRARVPPLGLPGRVLRRAAVRPIEMLRSAYYLCFTAIDRPGVLARIAGVLGRCDISIASVMQKERRQGTSVPIVMLTHEAEERNLQRALREIDRLPVVRGRSVFLRIEEGLGGESR